MMQTALAGHDLAVLQHAVRVGCALICIKIPQMVSDTIFSCGDYSKYLIQLKQYQPAIHKEVTASGP